jgi:hypothetical protein
MHADKGARPETGAWFVEAHPVRLPARARISGARFDDERKKSVRVVIVSSLFFVFFATVLLVGGHAAIDPLVRSAIAAREAYGAGAVLYTMPDGIFCRHMSFDNATGAVTEGALQRCAADIAGDRPHPRQGFAWRTP